MTVDYNSCDLDPYVERTLELIEGRGWRQFTFSDLAVDRGEPLHEIEQLFPEKEAIYMAVHKWLDRRVAEASDDDLEMMEGDELQGESKKEMLFDMLLSRIELMTPYKKAIQQLYDDIWTNPKSMMAMTVLLQAKMVSMLQAVGVRESYIPLDAQAAALGTAYTSVLEIWFTDDSADLSQTMAELDRRLTQLDALAMKAAV